MDDIEIQIFDEITNYKEKIGFFTPRQWLFVLIMAIVIAPTYIYLSEYIGSEITSYVVLVEAGVIGFVGFVPVHDLPAEKIIPYWWRQYTSLSKPISYMPLNEFYEKQNSKNNKVQKDKNGNIKQKDDKEKESINNLTPSKTDSVTSNKKLTKEEKDLLKAKKKYGYMFLDDKNELASETNNFVNDEEEEIDNNTYSDEYFIDRLSNLSPEAKKELNELFKR